MGTEDRDGFPADGEGPVREITVQPFAIGSRCVTNDQFAAFTGGTGYRTEAERLGWSFVFARFLPAPLRRVSRRVPEAPWWLGVDGAYWRCPEGPGSDLDGRGRHPVVHVSWRDARAYCRYPWGDELTPGGEHRCNIWQGRFPVHNTIEDGYAGTAPVDAYRPNGFGLFNVAGNVWEWCEDRWSAPGQPASRGADAERVMRGGSYLCHESHCNRYRVAARTRNVPDAATGNLGFRCAASPRPR